MYICWYSDYSYCYKLNWLPQMSSMAILTWHMITTYHFIVGRNTSCIRGEWKSRMLRNKHASSSPIHQRMNCGTFLNGCSTGWAASTTLLHKVHECSIWSNKCQSIVNPCGPLLIDQFIGRKGLIANISIFIKINCININCMKLYNFIIQFKYIIVYNSFYIICYSLLLYYNV